MKAARTAGKRRKQQLIGTNQYERQADRDGHPRLTSRSRWIDPRKSAASAS